MIPTTGRNGYPITVPTDQEYATMMARLDALGWS